MRIFHRASARLVSLVAVMALVLAPLAASAPASATVNAPTWSPSTWSLTMMDQLGIPNCPTTSACFDVYRTQTMPTVPTVITSTDGGNNWTTLTTLPSGSYTTGISCVSATVCTVGAMLNTSPFFAVYHTADGGATWTTTTLPTLTGITGGMYTEVHCFVSTTTCYDYFTYNVNMTFYVQFAKSTDGGATWTTQTLLSGFEALPSTLGGSLQCPSTTVCFVEATNNATGHATVLATGDGSSWANLTGFPAATHQTSMGLLVCPTSSTCGALVTDVQTGAISWDTGGLTGSWTATSEALTLPYQSGSYYMPANGNAACLSATNCFVALSYQTGSMSGITYVANWDGTTFSFATATALVPMSFVVNGTNFLGVAPSQNGWNFVTSGNYSNQNNNNNVVSAPSAPQASVSAPDANTVAANWSAVSGATSYQCTLLSGFNTPTTFTQTTSGTSCSFTNLGDSSNFGISVVAINSSGASSASSGFAPATPKAVTTTTMPVTTTTTTPVVTTTTTPKPVVKTITCVKGKATVKRAGANPSCPAGYKLK